MLNKIAKKTEKHQCLKCRLDVYPGTTQKVKTELLKQGTSSQQLVKKVTFMSKVRCTNCHRITWIPTEELAEKQAELKVKDRQEFLNELAVARIRAENASKG